MKKIVVGALTILVMFTVGAVVFTMLLAFMCAGLVVIENPRAIFRLRPRMIVLSNHPDAFDFMYEVILVPALFFLQAILHPLKLAPKIPLDGKNFTEKWCFWWLRLLAIPTVRGRVKKTAVQEEEEMLVAMRENKVMIYFGSGRDCTGTKRCFSKSGKNYIREPTHGIGRVLANVPDVCVGLIYVNAGDVPIQPVKPLFSWPRFLRIHVRFGPILNSNQFAGQNPHRITKAITGKQLELADQTNRE